MAAVIERSGLSPRSHSGKDLMTILENYPRDELFQIKTDELFESVMGVLRLAGRRQLRLFVRRDSYGRFVSCLVYLPRDRFTTANRLAIQEILLRELNGVGVDFTTRLGESLLARIHFIVRTDPTAAAGRDRRRGDPGEAGRRPPATGTTTSGCCSSASSATSSPRTIYNRYVNALPEAYKDVHTPGEACKDIAKLELLEEPRPAGDARLPAPSGRPATSASRSTGTASR